MPERTISLSASQRTDLASVCAAGAGKIDQVTARLNETPVTIRSSRIRDLIGAVVGTDKKEAFGRVIFGLATASRRVFSDTKSTLDSVTSALIPHWSEDQMKTWAACQPALERLLNAKSVALAAKASDLAFDVERFCVGVRIVTDIRPVFDGPREAIVGSTIRQTLRLEYVSLDGSPSSISIGLDSEDIGILKSACEEALRKAEVAKITLESKGLPELLMPGEDL